MSSPKEKSPRTFRNALWQFLVDNKVDEDAASLICTEAELYVNAYEAYKLRDIEFAAKEIGFIPKSEESE